MYQIYRCAQCGAAFAEPRQPDHEIYDQIYRQSAHVPGYRRYPRYANVVDRSRTPLADLARQEDVYWGVVQALERTVAVGRVLEVGSGLGYLTAALARSGYDVRGLDISQVAVEAATRRFGPLFIHSDVFAFAEAHPGMYDVVIACELIEHLIDPVGFLEASMQLLRRSGELIVTTPNRTLFDQDVAWETEPPPVHFWWFSERSMELLARRIGAGVAFIDFSEYQHVSPAYIPRRVPVNSVTRHPTLDAAGKLFSGFGAGRELRAVIGDALPILRSSATVQRIRGRRRIRGPRRATMCAVFRKQG